MFNIVVAVLFFILITPLRVEALPPPDLIIGISQSILNVLGLLTAALIVIFGTLRIQLRMWNNTKLGRIVMYSLCVSIIVFASTTLWVYSNNKAIEDWKITTDAELREIWDLYDPVYSSSDELQARSSLESYSREVMWSEFKSLTNNQEYLILDIRDSYPFELGRVEGSVNIRFSDLIRGRWEELVPYRNKPILFVDYLGTTGTLLSQFLNAKGFNELYQLKDGLFTTRRRDKDLPFLGTEKTPKIQQAAWYISLKKAQKIINNNVEVIDVRSPSLYATDPELPITKRFFRDKATEAEIETFVKEMDDIKSYIFLCQGEVSCYFAGILVHDFDEAGLEVIAIYNSEYADGKRNYYYENPQ